jgi:hypothetical protein
MFMGNDDLIYIIQKLGNQLTTLSLTTGDVSDVGYLQLKDCARLQELELLGFLYMSDRALVEGIGSLQGLTSLHLDAHSKSNLTAQGLSTFLHGPSEFHSVVEVDRFTLSG